MKGFSSRWILMLIPRFASSEPDFPQWQQVKGFFLITRLLQSFLAVKHLSHWQQIKLFYWVNLCAVIKVYFASETLSMLAVEKALFQCEHSYGLWGFLFDRNSTLRAYEWIFSFVNSHVDFKVSINSETFTTLLAVEKSPVWTLMWTLRFPSWQKLFPHSLHV